MIQVHLNELPPEGRRYFGEIRNDVFKLPGPDDPRMAGPVRYDVTVTLDRDLIVVEGEVTADFELECTRCLERFPWHVSLDPYSSEDPRDGRSILDLTEVLREDILLALPGYPHCENSNVSPRNCPAAGKFAQSSEYAPQADEDASESRSRDIWGVLDQVKEKIDPKPPQ
jgi:uncharacterized metal-binding protein YceD (DUF177 family)